ncbi:MAG: hypothetical protein ACRD3G_31285 [Vicinamibacterales bacterium]
MRERLGPERWARGYAAGRHTSIDSLLKDIDATLSSVALAWKPEYFTPAPG